MLRSVAGWYFTASLTVEADKREDGHGLYVKAGPCSISCFHHYSMLFFPQPKQVVRLVLFPTSV